MGNMIKYINRIIYALIVAVGFMVVYNLTDQYYRSLYLLEIGNEALAESDYEYFVSARFYNDVPLLDEVIQVDDQSFKVMIYEGATIQYINQQYIVSDGMLLLIHQLSGDALPQYFDVFVNAENDISEKYLGVQIFDLPLYTALHPVLSKPIIYKNLFVIDDQFNRITSFELSLGEDLLLEIPTDFDETDFTVKEKLDDYIEIYQKIPESSFDDVTMAIVHEIHTATPIIRNLSIYLIFVIIVTALLFTYRNKKMGKKSPTIGVMKDIQTLDEHKQKKR